jgi:hypothetical protein
MAAQVEPSLLKKGICASVIQSNENMIASVLVDEKGRVKEMEISDDDIFGNLSAVRRARLFDDLVLRQIMRREFDGDCGLEEYTLTKRSKMNLISFPINDSFLIVVTQPFIDTYHTCKKILKIIRATEKTIKT